jgi:cytochrome P450
MMPVCCADRRTMDDLDPFAPELIDDPYATYAWLREHEPVHWNKRLGTWWISKYADVAAVLVADEGISSATRTYDLGLNASVDLGPFGKTNTLPTLDPPEHTRVRALTMPPFRRRPVAELLPRINGIIDEQLSALSADGQADLMPRLAESLPIRVIAEMLGVPPERSRVFKAWSMDLQRAFHGPAATAEDLRLASQAAANLTALFASERDRHAASPDDDLLCHLMHPGPDGQELSRSEFLATAVLLLVAGNETTTYLIANGLYELLRRPDQLALLRSQPDLVPSAVEEMLRFAGPVHMVVRRATRDLTIGGTVIPAGDAITLLLGSAGRDPERFADADAFDITRAQNDHVAFGRGRHLCVGAYLARVEAAAAVAALIERFPRLRLRPGFEAVFVGSLASRGLTSLPVELG